MKVWRLVAGIISIILSVVIVFQSMAAGALNALSENGESSGTVGFLCAILILSGGIVSIATKKSRKTVASITLIALFGIAGIVGIVGHGNFGDLVVWSIWALLNAVIALLSCFIGKEKEKVNDRTDSISLENETNSDEKKVTCERESSDDTNQEQNIDNWDSVWMRSVNENSHETNSTQLEDILKRAFMFLEDEDWKNARYYCEKALDLSPENAMAHLGKFMAQCNIAEPTALSDRYFDSNNSSFRRALKYSDGELSKFLTECSEQASMKTTYKEVYDKAKKQMEVAKTADEFRSLAKNFLSIKGFQDSAEMAEQCEKMAKVHLSKHRRNLVIGLIVTVVIIGGLIVGVILFDPFNPRQKGEPVHTIEEAMKLLEAEKYTEAYAILEELGQPELIGDKWDVAFKCLWTENDSLGHRLLSELYNSTTVGDTIRFGMYEQDGDSQNGKEDVEWIVIDKLPNSTLLLLSKKALAEKPYDSAYSYIGSGYKLSWRESEIRLWLNDVFLYDAFSAKELYSIETGRFCQLNEKNSGETDIASDRVFLLSDTEINLYSGLDEVRKCVAADSICTVTTKGRESLWWLRTPDAVYGGGEVKYYRTCTSAYGIRPVVRIQLK